MTQEIDINKIKERNDDVRKKFNNYELMHETVRPVVEYMAEALKKCQKVAVDGNNVAVVVPNAVATTACFLLEIFINYYLDEGEEET